ncbi:MAG: calcium-binding protein [Pseudomonadota bacterium]
MDSEFSNASATGFQYGYIDPMGVFIGVTVFGEDFTYDIDGAPTAGTVTKLELTSQDGLGGYAVFRLSNLPVDTVAGLDAALPDWYTIEKFFSFVLTFPGVEFSLVDETPAPPVGDQVLVGDADNNTLSGAEGNDNIRGKAGDDQLSGAAGNDELFGNQGMDLLLGGAGNDTLRGGQDDDQLYGGDTSVLLGSIDLPGLEIEEDDTNTGNDQLFGGKGNDGLYTGDGNDLLNGGDGNDNLFSTGGSNTFIGGAGNDAMIGGDGDDIMKGNTGEDIILGNAGNNELRGGKGDDILISLGTDDDMWGGQDSDLFVFSDEEYTGTATIHDFDTSEDMFAVQKLLTTTTQEQFDDFTTRATQAGDNVMWDNGNGFSVLILDTDLADFSLANFEDVEGQLVLY